ncbi:hypothetical protein BFS14_01915 [Serratia fonticola]|uniref:hypothetical protein n=1 Tax=Serratia fonticola TaxID=47917 RepID=UPI0008FD32E4|nr:hypothetical protein [Serratia fonticola]OIX96244.1 hypothetical protein BFS14_01915 [Serratia fonticola]QCR60834.1 hypothetical protein FD644_10855 [Serratia fonticola]
MDKQTESREQFEKWFNKQMVMPIIASNETVVRLMWKAWQASRESLVVDLPVCTDVNSAKSFAGRAMLTGKNSAITKCADALRAIGIRIKGEAV